MGVIGSDAGLTYAEKERALKARLAKLLRQPKGDYRLNTWESTETGREYTDQAIDTGELLCAFGLCTERQQRLLRLWLGGHDGRRLTQAQAAKIVGMSLATASREATAALRTMAGVVWEEEMGEF